MTLGSKNTAPKKKGGKRAKKGKKFVAEIHNKYLLLKDAHQEYVKVTSLLGDCRIKGENSDGKERICSIRGKMHKRVWINANDIVLIGLRDFQDDKGDVIHKYSLQEAKELVKRNEIPSSMLVVGSNEEGNDDDESGINWDASKITNSKNDNSENSNDDSNDNDEINNEYLSGPAPQRIIRDVSEISDDDSYDMVDINTQIQNL